MLYVIIFIMLTVSVIAIAIARLRANKKKGEEDIPHSSGSTSSSMPESSYGINYPDDFTEIFSSPSHDYNMGTHSYDSHDSDLSYGGGDSGGGGADGSYDQDIAYLMGLK